MSRKEKRPEETTAEEQKAPETAEPVQTEQPAPEAGEAETDPLLTELEALKDQAAQQDQRRLEPGVGLVGDEVVKGLPEEGLFVASGDVLEQSLQKFLGGEGDVDAI